MTIGGHWVAPFRKSLDPEHQLGIGVVGRQCKANAVRCTNNAQLWGSFSNGLYFNRTSFSIPAWYLPLAAPLLHYRTKRKSVSITPWRMQHLRAVHCRLRCRHPSPCWYAIDMKQLSFMQSTLMIFHVMIMRPAASFTFSVHPILHLNVLLVSSTQAIIN